MARPTKYKKEYCNLVIDFMAQGYSKEAFAGKVGVAKQTVYNWMSKHSEFLDAIKIAEEKCRLFWEELGLEMTTSGQGNMTGWIFNMKNRFNWKDKRDVTSDDEKLPGPVIYKPTIDDE